MNFVVKYFIINITEQKEHKALSIAERSLKVFFNDTYC